MRLAACCDRVDRSRTETIDVRSKNGRTMTCTGGRLAAFLEMDSALSVPRDV
jgi:hypothetical protein